MLKKFNIKKRKKRKSKKRKKKYNFQEKFIKIIALILYFCFYFYFHIFYNNNFVQRKKRVGVISLSHGNNIGNNLLKYAIFIKLSELGFNPFIIGTHKRKTNISFIKRATNLRIIKKDFSEIKRKDYDLLMVNSDQTWLRKNEYKRDFYNIAFLKFAKKWKIHKFAYGVSLGYNYWNLTKEDEIIAKECLKSFSNISVRENSSISLIEKYLGFRPILVLDPTLLIDKRYYLNIINNFKEKKLVDGKCILTYTFLKEKNTVNFIYKASRELNYKIYNVKKKHKNSIEKFIYGIYNCKAVITNSYHGTLFSIIFNKPFVAFMIKDSPKERFISLKETLGIKDRIFEYYQIPNINMLKTPLEINYKIIDNLRNISINYLKKNLEIDK